MTPDPGHDDLVDVLAADHRRLLDLLDHAAAADPGPQRTDLGLRAARAVRRHCAVEERVLHPVLRRCLDDGERATQADVEEHEQLDRLVGELLDAGPEPHTDGRALRSLAAAARRHVEGVESWRLPELRGCLTVSELHALARDARADLGSDDHPAERADGRPDERPGPATALG